MPGNRRGRAAQADGHRDVRQRRQLEIQRVGEDQRARRNSDGRGAAEGDGPIGSLLNRAAARRSRDADRVQRELRVSERVRQAQPHLPPADRYANDLPQRCVAESRRRRQVCLLDQLGSGRPGADPFVRGRLHREAGRSGRDCSGEHTQQTRDADGPPEDHGARLCDQNQVRAPSRLFRSPTPVVCVMKPNVRGAA